jgi:hypothetical protein
MANSLGVAFGPDAHVRQHCEAKVEAHEPFFAALRHPAMPTQIAFHLLRMCGQPRANYLARTVPPALFAEAATKFDQRVLDTLLQLLAPAAQSPLHQRPLPPQLLLRITLPVCEGGLGLRSVADTSPAAFFASLAAALPDFLAELPLPSFHSPNSARQFDHSQMQPHALWKDAWERLQAQGVGRAPPEPTTADEPARLSCIPRSDRPTNATNSEPAPRPLSLFHETDPLQKLWLQAKQQCALLRRSRSCLSHPAPTVFLEGCNLQKDATQQREQAAVKAFHQTASRFDATLLTAHAAPNAGALFVSLPTEPKYRVDDETMQLALRARLGLPPSDTLPLRPCICGASFVGDPDHLQSCHKTVGPNVTHRHDQLVHTLAQLAKRHCGFVVTYEPNDHLRSVATNAEAQRRTEAAVEAGRLGELPEHYNRHGDLLLVRHGLCLYVDVSVVRPTIPSLQHTAATHKPLHAAEPRQP